MTLEPAGRSARARSRRLAALALVLLLAACARIAPPQGGPEDREPPRILGTAPDSGATAVSLDAPIEIRFNERMNRSQVQDGLRVAPWPGRLECRWNGNTLSCTPLGGWSENTTYTVLLGAPAADRRRNALAARQYAFSTGDSLEAGRIEGLVRTRSLAKQAVPVYLFPWPAGLEPPVPPESSLRPDALEALRIAETDAEGKFVLSFVPIGEPFLAAALFDKNKNRVYDDGEDLWGFSETPVVVPDSGRVQTDVYLVYSDEEGDLSGDVADSLCAGFVPPARLRSEIDSLKAILSGARDPSGFVRSPGDTTAPVVLRAAERESLMVAADRLAGRLGSAVADSERCATPLWVSAISTTDSTITADVRTTGAFTIEGLAPGRYAVQAFRDMSGDGVRQPKEPWGRLAEPVDVKPGRAASGISIPIGGTEASRDSLAAPARVSRE